MQIARCQRILLSFAYRANYGAEDNAGIWYTEYGGPQG